MPFTFEKTELPDVILVTACVFSDQRGEFMEAFKATEFAAAGIPSSFVQDNASVSHAGVLRGLHYQLPPHAQGKLVSVTRGAVWDVAVDLRVASARFGRWVARELRSERSEMLWIPPGFAHGFLALENDTRLFYKCSCEYHPESEAGIRWDDPQLAIPWPHRNVLVSRKDRDLPLLADARLMETVEGEVSWSGS